MSKEDLYKAMKSILITIIQAFHIKALSTSQALIRLRDQKTDISGM